MLGIIATFKIKDGKQKEFEHVFLGLAAEVRTKEPGNKLYQLCKSNKDDCTYRLMELYDSQEALEAHRNTKHIQATFPLLAALFADKPEVEILDALTP